MMQMGAEVVLGFGRGGKTTAPARDKPPHVSPERRATPARPRVCAGREATLATEGRAGQASSPPPRAFGWRCGTGKKLGCPTANMRREDLGAVLDTIDNGIYAGWARRSPPSGRAAVRPCVRARVRLCRKPRECTPEHAAPAHCR